jgi:hypothetical protein
MKLYKGIICFVFIFVTLGQLLSCSSFENSIKTTTTATPVVTTKPEGSVIQKRAVNVSETLTDNSIEYFKVNIIVTVQNVGDEGSFYVNSSITTSDAVLDNRTPQKIKVYLRKGEVKEYTFDFWIKKALNSYSYNAWCSIY